MEPRRGVAAGKHVLLDAEGGDVEAVDHVLRGHDHFYVAADRHVEFVDLALASGVFDLPHPLFSDGVDLGGVCGGVRSWK